MFGIDVSQYQSRIDWNKVKNKIDFAILRLGWIGNKNNHTLDTEFERNYSECKRLKIPIGAYIYNYCNSEETIKEGANWTLQRLKDKTLNLPIYLDMEDSSIIKLGKNKLTNMCIAFNTVIENARLRAGVYANKNWFDNYLNKDEIKKRYTTWIANYSLSEEEQYKGIYDMWQNSNSAKIDGINGNVDTNYLYKDLIIEFENKEPEVENEKKGDEQVRVYTNGSTKEDVFSDTDCTNKIGSLDPRETCDCLGIFNNLAIVRYKVTGTNNYKIGFCKWIEGVK